MGNFAELYCKQHQLRSEDFEKEVLKKSLPTRIRMLAPVINYFWPDYFTPDRDFVRDVGSMRQPGDFKWALADFRSDSANRKLARRQLRVRASISRMRRIIQSVPAFVTDQSRHEITGDPHSASED